MTCKRSHILVGLADNQKAHALKKPVTLNAVITLFMAEPMTTKYAITAPKQSVAEEEERIR